MRLKTEEQHRLDMFMTYAARSLSGEENADYDALQTQDQVYYYVLAVQRKQG